MRLILASASPRRAELLSSAGFQFEVRPVEVDETPRPGEAPDAYVTRLALAKSRALECRTPGDIVLGADTVVVVNGRLLGKPASDEDARQMLEMLSGRDHEVHTGVALRTADRELTSAELSRVRFLQLSPAEVAWYVSTGEPRDKAGAYAVQGLGSRFVDRIEGSYASVVGLPVARVYRMLRELDALRD